MKQIALIITVIIILISCSNKTKIQKETSSIILKEIHQTADTLEKIEEPTSTKAEEIIKYSEYESKSNEIPPNGKYRFDIAFAEWQGISMGEKVTVVINGDSIKIIYEGDGQLTLTKKGEVIDQGQIIKHKSGNWIISNNPSDKELDEVGGCTDGPAIIDFKNKKYWMC